MRLGDDGVIESAAGSRSGDITATIEGGDAVLEAARACARSSAKAADLGALMNEDGPEWWAFKTGFAACLKDAGIAARVGQPALATYESCAWPG